MSKLMTLELLSSIKGARPSPAVSELFRIIKDASPAAVNEDTVDGADHSAVSFEYLRNDEVIESSPVEKEIIRENFPERINDFLVVSKVIEEL